MRVHFETMSAFPNHDLVISSLPVDIERWDMEHNMAFHGYRDLNLVC